MIVTCRQRKRRISGWCWLTLHRQINADPSVSLTAGIGADPRLAELGVEEQPAALPCTQRGRHTTERFQGGQRWNNKDTLVNNGTAHLRALLLISPILGEAGEGHKT